MDLDRFLDGSPRTFNNHLLVYHRLKEGEDPMMVSLFWSDFWVQIHDLPIGLMSETMAKQFGEFIRQFIDYDAKSLPTECRVFMKIRVRLDVRNPMMRKKLILGRRGDVYARFRYERLHIFCFLYGRLGHTKRFCLVRIIHGKKEIEFE